MRKGKIVKSYNLKLKFTNKWSNLTTLEFLPTFVLSASEWIEQTNAIGIRSKAGRYGGTYAHKDIAFEFAMWIRPYF